MGVDGTTKSSNKSTFRKYQENVAQQHIIPTGDIMNLAKFSSAAAM